MSVAHLKAVPTDQQRRTSFHSYKFISDDRGHSCLARLLAELMEWDILV